MEQKRPTIIVAKDATDATRKMAERLVEIATAPDASRTTIALSGGSTPKLLYETLAAAPFRDRMPWDRVDLFFGDERSVPPDHADSNYRMVNEALLSKVQVEAHRMRAELDEAEAYERLLAEHIAEREDGRPVFEVVLLGIGKDGHTASLFPGTNALRETERWVVMNDVPQLSTRRMTLTYPVINNARRIWILATGADKQEILKSVFGSSGDALARERWPILGVQPTHGELVWWLDEAASKGLDAVGG
jgi:6-phosphogluconolactonase